MRDWEECVGSWLQICSLVDIGGTGVVGGFGFCWGLRDSEFRGGTVTWFFALD